MKLHRNAKTTPAMRALIVQRIRQEQWPPAEAAALEDASSRPHRQSRRTSATVVAAIIAARHDRRTAWEIATRLQVPRSTAAAVLVRVGLNRLAHCLVRGSDEHIVWAIEATGRRLGGLSTCLTRALVAELVLDPSNGPIRFAIGVRRTAAGALEAHAWLARDDRVLIGGTAGEFEPVVNWVSLHE